MRTGVLFEKALKEARINLEPGAEFKVIVRRRGAHLKLVVDKSDFNDFEATILERSKNAEAGMKECSPNLTLNERIRALRLARGLTIEALSKNAGLSKGTMCSIEKGKRSVGLLVLRRIASALNVPATHLLDS